MHEIEGKKESKGPEENLDETKVRQIRIYLHLSNLMEYLETLLGQSLHYLLHKNQIEVVVLQTWGGIL